MGPVRTWCWRDHLPADAVRLDWREPWVVYVGKEVTICVVVTRGGSSDEQPTGCEPPAREFASQPARHVSRAKTKPQKVGPAEEYLTSAGFFARQVAAHSVRQPLALGGLIRSQGCP
jgi:hypothetical protein